MNLSSFKKTAVLCGMMGLVAGCSNSDTQSTNTSAQSQDAPSYKTSVAQALTINNTSEPETLDPHLAAGVQEINIIRQFSEGLVSSDNDGNLVAGMATKWSSPDNKVWTFKLRDASWSNGDPVTAHDFVYSFRRLADPATGSYNASYLADAKVLNAQDIIDGKAKIDTLGVKAIDDKTLEITLSEPVPYLPDMLTHSSFQPVHQKKHRAVWRQMDKPCQYRGQWGIQAKSLEY